MMVRKFDELLGVRFPILRYIPRGGLSYLIILICVLLLSAPYWRQASDDIQYTHAGTSSANSFAQTKSGESDIGYRDNRHTAVEVQLGVEQPDYQIKSNQMQNIGGMGTSSSAALAKLDPMEYNPMTDQTQAIERGKMVMADTRIIIIGLVKNMGDHIAQGDIIRRVEEMGSMFKEYKVLVIENDSTDNTVAHLREWSKANERVKIMSSEFKFDSGYGKSTNHIRFKRMALIRNIYMLELAINPEYADTDYVSLLDMDNREGWSLDGLAISFALPSLYLPTDSGAEYTGKPLEWDVVCANGRLTYPALAWEYTPPGKPSVKELVQKHKGLDAMIKATRGKREPPHRYAEFAALVANGTYEYARHAYELVVEHTKHYTYTKVTKPTNTDYGGCTDTDMGGELQGEGVPGMVAFITAQLTAKQDRAVQILEQNQIRSKEEELDARLKKENGEENAFGIDPELIENARTEAISFAFETCDENDPMAVRDNEGNFDAGACMAKKFMTHIHAPRDILEGSTAERTNECFESAIAHWYRQGVDAQVKAALNYIKKYHIVPGRHYDSLAFRDKVFQKSNFRAHQYVTHMLTDSPFYVDSCFGGLAVYKYESMKGCQYDTQTMWCEHFSMHQCMAEKGQGKVLFNPAMEVKYVMDNDKKKKS